jgi:hypothetical protein
MESVINDIVINIERRRKRKMNKRKVFEAPKSESINNEKQVRERGLHKYYASRLMMERSAKAK